MSMSTADPLERVKGLAVIRRTFLDYPGDHRHKTEINDTASRELLENAVSAAVATGYEVSVIAEAAQMTAREIALIASDAA